MNFITDVKLPNGMKSIGESAFAGATALKEVLVYGESSSEIATINDIDGVDELDMSIGKNAFDGCSILEKVAIPDGVTSIEEDVFTGCVALEEIYIPTTVTVIEDLGLTSEIAENLTIYYAGTEEDWNNIEVNDTIIEETSDLVEFDTEVETEPAPETPPSTEDEDDDVVVTPPTTNNNGNTSSGSSGGSSGGSYSGNSSSSSSNSSSNDEVILDELNPDTDDMTETETAEDNKEIITFSDSGEFSNWASDSVEQMQKLGILNGKGNNIFDAKGTGTRAEFCSMMERFILASEQ